MKKIFILIIVFMLFTFNNSIKSQSIDCINELTPPTWNCDGWSANISEDVTVIPYGGAQPCPVEVHYQFRVCKRYVPGCEDSVTTIQIKILGIDVSDLDCPDTFAWLFPGWPNDFSYCNTDNVAKLLKLLYDKLSDMTFNNYYNSLSELEKVKYKCLVFGEDCTFPNCPNFEVHYIVAKCIGFCWNVVVTPGGEHIAGFTVIKCNNNQDCCECLTYYCVCPINGTLKSQQSCTTVEQDDCGNLTPESCPIGNYVSPCILFCPLNY